MSKTSRHKKTSSSSENLNVIRAKTGRFNNITDVPGIGVGNAHEESIKTGVSVIKPAYPFVCAGDVRGGGPGTRETDLLDPATLVQTVNALVLSGGSSYGLGAADAVATQLGADGEGFGLMKRPGVPPSPIVPCAILYDLANGGDKNWGTSPPYHTLGTTALKQVQFESQIDLGQAGAGFGAMAGQERGGLGSASIVEGDMIVGALMAVNSFGSVRMPNSSTFWSWCFEIEGEFGNIKPQSVCEGAAGFPDDSKFGPLPLLKDPPAVRENTTIGVVALNHAVNQSEAKRIAIMAQDGLARAIRPVHAPTDGDVIFVLAPPAEPGHPPSDSLTLTLLGNLAADCVARAIARGVYEAQN